MVWNWTGKKSCRVVKKSPSLHSRAQQGSFPSTNKHAFSCRRLSSTVTDVVVLEVKPPQTSIGLKAFGQGLANSCRGETAGIRPLSPPGKEQGTHRGKLTEYPTCRQNHWETTCQEHCFSAATHSHAGEVFKFAFSKFAIQSSDSKEQPPMLRHAAARLQRSWPTTPLHDTCPFSHKRLPAGRKITCQHRYPYSHFQDSPLWHLYMYVYIYVYI